METDRGPELTAQEIYRRVNPSVVTVLAQLEGSASVGTGVIFRSDGYIPVSYTHLVLLLPGHGVRRAWRKENS